MFYDDDIDVFFDEFSEDVVYQEFGVAASSTISGIFDLPGSVIQIGRVAMVVESPQVRLKSTDVSNISNNDSMAIRSKTYRVVNATDDGTGVVTAVLAEGKR